MASIYRCLADGRTCRITHGMNRPYAKGFYRSRDDSTRASAEAVVPLMVDWVGPRSVVDVGCGVGTWLDVFRASGVEDVFGVEGSWVDPSALVIPRARFLAHDLRRPLELGRTFDLALSLEVAEHLPPESAETLVGSLVRLAPVVLFSAAVPFQGGRHHVHERWPEYWAGLFADVGYAVADAVRPRVWNTPGVKVWYAQNSLLYVRRDRLADLPRLAAEVTRTDPERLAMAHPRLYERNSDLRRQSLGDVLAVLPHLVGRAVRRRSRVGHRGHPRTR